MTNKVTVNFEGDHSALLGAVQSTVGAFHELNAAAGPALDSASTSASAASGEFDGLHTSLGSANEGFTSTLQGVLKFAVGFNQLLELGGKVMGMFGKLKDVGAETVALWQVQASAVRKLNAVLDATGNVTGFTSQQLQNHASHLQSITTTGDETILGVQKLIATFKNVRGDEFLRATELSLDMADIMGGDASSAAMQLAKALQDPLTGIGALSRAGVQFSAAQKSTIATMIEMGDVTGAQKIILDELAGQFGGAAATAAASYGGQMQQLSNRIGDAKERIGQLIEQGLMLLAPHLESAVVLIENVTTSIINSANGFMQYSGIVSGAIETAKNAIIDNLVYAYTALEHSMENSGAKMQWWGELTALVAVRVGNDFAHLFTDVLPAYMTWLGDNWANLMQDMIMMTKATTENMFSNFKNFFEAMWSWVQGDGFNFEWTSLLDGFEATMDELPAIAARKKGAIEEALEISLGTLDAELSRGFEQKLTERRKQMADLFQVTASKFDFTHNAALVDPAQFRKAEKTEQEKKEEKEKAQRQDKAKTPDYATEGAESLYQRIADAAASAEDAQHQEQIAMLEKIEHAVKEIVMPAPPGLENAMAEADKLQEMADVLFPDLPAPPAAAAAETKSNDDIAKRLDTFITLAQSVVRALPLQGTLS